MKLVLRAATALAILGLATPAFPCGENKMTTASSTSATTKDTKDTKEKGAVAKSEKKAQAKTAKETPQKAAATN